MTGLQEIGLEEKETEKKEVKVILSVMLVHSLVPAMSDPLTAWAPTRKGGGGVPPGGGGGVTLTCVLFLMS